MSKIDERIVELKFNTSDFEKGVRTTLNGMKELDTGLQLDNVSKGVSNIASKLAPLGVVGFTAFNRLTNAAIDFGKQFISNVINPIEEGGQRRALNMEQARFQFKGLGMDVEQAMEDSLYAVKGTAYGLDEAAMAASMFGASGVKSGDEMKQALLGISGVAAMTGSSYGDMANVFTKVAGQGRVMGDDLNRLASRGLNAGAELAKFFRETGRDANATEESIRKMVSKGQIDFKTFSQAMSGAFGEHATSASDTFNGALANVNAALARIGEARWAPKLERQRKLFNALAPVVDGIGEAFKILNTNFVLFSNRSNRGIVNIIDALGFGAKGSPQIVEDLKQIATNIYRLITPIRNAFYDIFTPIGQSASEAKKQVQPILDFLHNLAENTKITEDTVNGLRSTFRGLFSIFGIFGEVIKGVVSGIQAFFSTIASGFSGSGGGGGLLKFTGSIGDLIYSFHQLLKESGAISKFFSGIGTVLAYPIKIIATLIVWIKNLIGALIDLTKNAWNSDFIQDIIGGFNDLVNTVSGYISKFVNEIIQSDFVQAIIGAFKNIGESIKDTSADIKNNIQSMYETIVGSDFGSTIVAWAKGIGEAFAILFQGATPSGEFINSKSFTDSLVNIRNSVGTFGGYIGEAFSTLFGGTITGFWEEDSFIISALEGIHEAFSNFGEAFQTVVTLLQTGEYDGAVWSEESAIVTSLVTLREATLDFKDAIDELYKVLFYGDTSGTIFSQDSALVKSLLFINSLVVTVRESIRNALGFFSGFSIDIGDIGTVFSWIGSKLQEGFTAIINASAWGIENAVPLLEKAANWIASTASKIGQTIAGIYNVLRSVLGPVIAFLWQIAKDIGAVIWGIIQGIDFDRLLAIVDTTALVIVAKGLWDIGSWLKSFITENEKPAKSLASVIENVFDALTAGLETLQSAINIGNIMAVAFAVAILTASMVALSSLDDKELGKGIVGLASVFLVLTTALSKFAAILSAPGLEMFGFIKVALGLILISVAVLILTQAIKQLGKLEWDEIVKGLIGLGGAVLALILIMKNLNSLKVSKETGLGIMGVAAAMAILAAAMVLMSVAVLILSTIAWQDLISSVSALIVILGAMVISVKALNGLNMTQSAGGLLALAVAMGLMALSLKLISTIPFEQLTTGMLGLVVGLAAMVGAIKNLDGLDATKAAASILILSLAMVVLAGALWLMGSIPFDKLTQGLLGLGISLVLMVGALKNLDNMTGLPAAAASILILSAAMGIMAIAINAIGSMNLNAMIQGLAGIAIVLVLFVTAINLIPENAAFKASGIVLIALALLVLYPVLLAFSKMSGGEIAASLIMVGGALLIIIGAAVLAKFAAVGLIVLGAAVLALGLAMLAAGTGFMNFANGIATLVNLDTKKITNIYLALESLAMALPVLLYGLGKGLVQFFVGFFDELPTLVEAMNKNYTALVSVIVLGVSAAIQALIELAPEIKELFVTLVKLGIEAVEELSAELAAAGFRILMDLLKGIDENLPEVMETVNSIIVSFIEGLEEGVKEIAPAITSLVVAIIEAIENHSAEVIDAGIGLIVTLIEGIGEGSADIATAVGEAITTFIGAIEEQTESIIEAGKNLILTFLKGIEESITEISEAVTNVIVAFIRGVDNNNTRIISAGTDLVVNFINGIGASNVQIVSAASQLIQDFLAALEEEIPEIADSALSLVETLAEEIGNSAHRLTDAAFNLVITLILGIADSIEKNMPILRDAGRSLGIAIIDGIAPGAREYIPGLNDFFEFETAPGTIEALRKGIGDEPNEVGKDIVQGLKDGVSSDNADDEAKKLGEGTIMTLEEILGIQSPSKKTHAMGTFLITGLINGMNSSEGSLTTNTTSIGSKLLGTFNSIFGISGNSSTKTKPMGTGLVTGIIGGIGGMSGNLYSTGTTTSNTTVNRFKGILTNNALVGSGKNTVGGIISGIGSMSGKLYGAGTNTSQTTLNRFKGNLNSNSLVSSGSSTVSGVMNGILNRQKFLFPLAALAASRTVSSITRNMSSRSTYGSGLAIMQGLRSGMLGGIGSLLSVASSVASSVLGTIKRTLGVASPAKEGIYIGEFLVDGLQIGIEKQSSRAISASEGVANSVLDTLRSAINGVSDGIGEDMTNPVIRPTMDLTDIEIGMSRLNTMLADSSLYFGSSYSQASEIQAMVRGSKTGIDAELRGMSPTNVTYVQNNNSPKSLPPSEIYRKTKSLLAMKQHEPL